MGSPSKSLNELLTAYNIYIIHRSGILSCIKININPDKLELNIVTHESTVPVNSNPPTFSRFQSGCRGTLKKVKTLTRRASSLRPPKSPGSITSLVSVSGQLRTGITLAMSEIQEIRVSDYNNSSKCNIVVNEEALNNIGIEEIGCGKNCTNKIKVVKIFFGLEFNLQCHNFLVTEVHENLALQQQPHRKEHNSQLERWVERVMELVFHENTNRTYFEKLDEWYMNQYIITLQTNLSTNRVKLWSRFLQRNHSNFNGFDHSQEILTKYFPSSSSNPIELSEFELVAKYFVHSEANISRIFENFHNNEYDEDISHLFESFFRFIANPLQKYEPISCADIEVHSQKIGAVVRWFAEHLQEENTNQLIRENWISSYYVLDYLYSSHNRIWSPEKLELYQDMTQPLSKYFIASSHNTYLTGNQISSQSSCETFARVLRQGCRCIEIDVWNGSEGKPIVKHGNTMTTSVKLKHVLKVVKEHAFASSSYPVIISIENHCSLKQQKLMAKYFLGIFGKMLYTCKFKERDLKKENKTSSSVVLPSPEELKNRIILKGRTLPPMMFKETIRNIKSDLRRSIGLRLMSSSTDQFGIKNNRDSNMSTVSNGPAYVEANDSEYLLIGELWMKCESDNQTWAPQIFLLNSKTMLCIEGRSKSKSDRRSVLPANPLVPQSLSSDDLMQECLLDYMWFHGNIPGGHKYVLELMQKKSITGSFLVWENNIFQDHFILTIFYPNVDDTSDPAQPHEMSDTYHIPIQSKKFQEDSQAIADPVYFLENNLETFGSIVELVEHYQQNPIQTTTFQLDHLGPPVHVSIAVTHESQEWFYGNMDQLTSELVLKKISINGLFLGRYKDGIGSEFVISFCYDSQIKHCCVERNGRYLTISNLKFRKLEDIVEYYSANAFYKNLKLVIPLNREMYDKATNGENIDREMHNPHNFIAAVNKNNCRVRAIVSHRSSDPEMLSFKKDDEIDNVVKGPYGLWQGTKHDMVGEENLKKPKQFWSLFVEEVDKLDCPFVDYVGKFTWELGTRASSKICTSGNARAFGIKYYIVFEGPDGSKRKLGTTNSRVADQWADMINAVLDRDDDLKKRLHQKNGSEKHKIAAELSDLICLPNLKRSGITEEMDDAMPCCTKQDGVSKVKSVKEPIALQSFRANPAFWLGYHQDCLTRIYPYNWISSSNFNPVPLWNFGSQLVALNYQTPDIGMQVNRGQFKQNGNCGYVLKPHSLLTKPQEEQMLLDPSSAAHVVECRTMLAVEIIGARHLEKITPGTIKPVVELEIFGVDADCRKVKTSHQENGLNPSWCQGFQFIISCPEQAFIQFRVHDEDNFNEKVFLGETTIPISCIRQGYRSVVLNNPYGSELFSRILIKITINEAT